MGAVTRLEHHLAGARRGVPLKRRPPAGRIDPGVTDTPEQQQRTAQLGKQLIEGLAAGDVKHRAKHPEGARIARRPQDRLHQLLIDIGAVDVHLVQGAAHRRGAAQILKQQPLQHRTLEQGATDGLAGDGTPPLGRRLLVGERPGGVEQHHSGRLVTQGHARSQRGEAPQRIAHEHGGAADALAHVGGQLVAPERPAIGEPGRFGAAAEPQQVDGVNLMGAGQHRQVVAPVVGGGAESMHQQQRRTGRALGGSLDRVHAVIQKLPGVHADAHVRQSNQGSPGMMAGVTAR